MLCQFIVLQSGTLQSLPVIIVSVCCITVRYITIIAVIIVSVYCITVRYITIIACYYCVSLLYYSRVHYNHCCYYCVSLLYYSQVHYNHCLLLLCQFIVLQSGTLQSLLLLSCQFIVLQSGRENFPGDYDYFASNYNSAVKDLSGNDGPFSYGSSVDCGYSLQPGTYLLLIHANAVEDQNDFALAIYSENPIKIE